MKWIVQSQTVTLTACTDDMRDADNSKLSHDVVCKSWRPEPDFWTMRTSKHACINSRVEVHVRCVEGALGLGGHVVIGDVRLVARFHHADAVPSVEVFPSGFEVQLRTCVRIVCDCNFISNQIVAHFYIANTGHLRCCLHTPPVGYSRPTSAVNDPSVTNLIEL